MDIEKLDDVEEKTYVVLGVELNFNHKDKTVKRIQNTKELFDELNKKHKLDENANIDNLHEYIKEIVNIYTYKQFDEIYENSGFETMLVAEQLKYIMTAWSESFDFRCKNYNKV